MQGIGKTELAPTSVPVWEKYTSMWSIQKGSAENKYSAMDLRTMQDWIVARQLYGTPGVAEVNSFGGLLKQYEVTVNPAGLKAMSITIAEIFTVGRTMKYRGAYIDKASAAIFIRGIGW